MALINNLIAGIVEIARNREAMTYVVRRIDELKAFVEDHMRDEERKFKDVQESINHIRILIAQMGSR